MSPAPLVGVNPRRRQADVPAAQDSNRLKTKKTLDRQGLRLPISTDTASNTSKATRVKFGDYYC